MIPTIGRLVHYRLTVYQADDINRRRNDATDKIELHRAQKTGTQVHVGNYVSAGDVFPMMIVRVWSPVEGGAVNGQLHLDGNDIYWLTSVCEGTREGEWFVPPKV